MERVFFSFCEIMIAPGTVIRAEIGPPIHPFVKNKRELVNELLSELKELKNLQKIESLEKELINNLDEHSYSELIKLKSQLNRE